MTDVVVHPAGDLAYGSMIIDGLCERLGESAIHYSTKGFPRKFKGGRVLAFYLADTPDARCFVSLHDHARVNQLGLDWSTVYGIVNVDPHDVASHEQLVPIGPTFGVRLRSHALTARHLSRAVSCRLPSDLRGAVEVLELGWKHQRRRLPISRYVPSESDPDYVFFVAWPWAKHREVNPARARFIETCLRAPDLEFEGGFAPRRRDDVEEVRALSATKRYSISQYLARVSRSAVAFNNPAVHGCLGWKLGEFLALGKAIITLPIERDLPAPLVHGRHVHVVDGSDESLDDALSLLRRDDGYRRSLERNARAWFDENLTPARLADRLLSRLRVA